MAAISLLRSLEREGSSLRSCPASAVTRICGWSNARLCSRAELDGLLDYFREGGPANMRALVRRLAGLAGADHTAEAPVSVPKAGFYDPGSGVADSPAIFAGLPADAPVVPILFYRSMLLAADVAPIDALVDALRSRGIAPVPIFVASLKDASSASFVERAIADLKPSAIVTATAFATGAEPGVETLFDRAGVPVFQVIVATTRREAWESSQRGLAPADLAMHVVMPELDGRILAGAVSFKAESETDAALAFRAFANRPEPDRVAQVAGRIEAFVRLQRTPRPDRKLAILMPDYPGAPGRTGYAVGLDVPASVIAMLHDLKNQGYAVDGIPESPRKLLDLIEAGGHVLSRDDYAALARDVPTAAREAVEAAWGTASEGAFPFRAASFGNVTVALAPDRGRSADRRADYHDPTLPPRHALVAFGLWLRHSLGCHALIHVGAHGTLEWLPGKTVALSGACFPEIVTGSLPVIYPFIVSNPGEAAQAKRRIAAVTLGHLPPPLVDAGLDENQQKLERLVDEYAQADGLDRRRRDRLAKLIVETASQTGLAARSGCRRG